MSAFIKLAQARVKLQNVEMSKSGYNKHLSFSYPELQDFLPHINEINEELKLISLFTFNEKGNAQLTIVDADKEDSIIVFESPVADAKLQGKPSPIQELGSQHTYMRRYMYMLAYEISMPDAIDKSKQDKEEPSNQLSEKQIKRLNAIAYGKGYGFESVLKTAQSKFKVNTLEDLTIDQYNQMCEGFEKAEPNGKKQC